RAEAVESASVESLARTEPAGSLPPELRQGLDVVVIMLHGPYGEDGTIQGLFELADVPYVGAGVLASAVGMDKATMKAVFQAHGLPIVEHLVVTRHEWRQAPERVAARVAETVGFPCFVKPVNLGSRVGISQVPNNQELAVAAFRAIDCSGMARVDFFVERDSDRVVVNEINTIPGFTATSAYAKMWAASGLPYADLVDRLIELALERHQSKGTAG